MPSLEWDEYPGRPRPPEEREATEYLKRYAEWVAQQQQMVLDLDEDIWAAKERQAMEEHDATGSVGYSAQAQAGAWMGEAVRRKKEQAEEAILAGFAALDLRRVSKKKRRRLAIKRLRRALKEALHDLK